MEIIYVRASQGCNESTITVAVVIFMADWLSCVRELCEDVAGFSEMIRQSYTLVGRQALK